MAYRRLFNVCTLLLCLQWSGLRLCAAQDPPVFQHSFVAAASGTVSGVSSQNDCIRFGVTEQIMQYCYDSSTQRFEPGGAASLPDSSDLRSVTDHTDNLILHIVYVYRGGQNYAKVSTEMPLASFNGAADADGIPLSRQVPCARILQSTLTGFVFMCCSTKLHTVDPDADPWVFTTVSLAVSCTEMAYDAGNDLLYIASDDKIVAYDASVLPQVVVPARELAVPDTDAMSYDATERVLMMLADDKVQVFDDFTTTVKSELPTAFALATFEANNIYTYELFSSPNNMHYFRATSSFLFSTASTPWATTDKGYMTGLYVCKPWYITYKGDTVHVYKMGVVTPSPATPAPLTPSPETPSPPTVTPPTPAPLTPAPETPSPPTPAPLTPSPVTPSPPTQSPATPAPPTTVPVTPSPPTSAPPTPSPPTPAPLTPSPETPSPPTQSPDTPVPPTTVPVTPSPPTPAPTTPAPQTSSPLTPAPPTQSPPTPAPATPSPPTSSPATPSPQTLPPATPAPLTIAPPTPFPPTLSPATPSPPTSAPDTLSPTVPTSLPLGDTVAPPTPAPRTAVPDTPAPDTLTPTALPVGETFAPSTTTPATQAPTNPPATLAPDTTVPTSLPVDETHAPDTATPATQAQDTASPQSPTPTALPPTQQPPSVSPATTAPGAQVSDVPDTYVVGDVESSSDGSTEDYVRAHHSGAVVEDMGRASAATAGVADASSVASLVSGASAGSALRLAVVGQLCKLGEPMAQRTYPFVLHPTQWTLFGSQAAGLVVGNFLVTVSFWVVMSVVVQVVMCTGYFKAIDAVGMCRFPSAPLFVFQFLLQGTALGAIALVFYPPSTSLFLLGFAALAFCCGVPFFVLYSVRVGVPRKGYYLHDTDMRGGRTWLSAVVGPGEWVSRCEAELWHLRYAAVIRPYHEEWVCFSFVEMAASLTVSAVNSSTAHTLIGCGHQKLSSALIFVVLLCAEVATWPHARARDGYMLPAFQILQAAGLGLMAAGYYAEDTGHWTFGTAAKVFIACSVLLACKAVCDVCTELYLFATKRRMRLQAYAYGQEALTDTQELHYTPATSAFSAADVDHIRPDLPLPLPPHHVAHDSTLSCSASQFSLPSSRKDTIAAAPSVYTVEPDATFRHSGRGTPLKTAAHSSSAGAYGWSTIDATQDPLDTRQYKRTRSVQGQRTMM